MLVIAVGSSVLMPGQPADPAVVDPAELDQAAPAYRLASEALLLDLARAGDRIVAVGDHGIALVSDNEGVTWTQASVPVQSLLTCVSFADSEQGWAGGHGGLLLSTVDGGLSWQRVDSPTVEDDSFLDILALSSRHIIAVGAYGLYCETRNGGATWKTRYVLPEDMHINRLFRTTSGEILMAGESGTLAHSVDNGANWDTLESPYNGSLYGLFELADGRWLTHGLRGHVYISDDRGGNWRQVRIEQQVLLMAGIESTPGKIILSGLGGWVYVSTNGGATFTADQPDGLSATAEMLVSGSDALITVGTGGVQRWPMP